MGGGQEVQEEGEIYIYIYIYTHVTDSCCCTAENNTTV